MAKKVKVANFAPPARVGVEEFLDWVVREIEAEIEVTINTIRLEKMKYEIERYRRDFKHNVEG